MDVEARKTLIIRILKDRGSHTVHQLYLLLVRQDRIITQNKIRYILKLKGNQNLFVKTKGTGPEQWRLATSEELKKKTKPTPQKHSYCECGCTWCDMGGHCRNTDRGCYM